MILSKTYELSNGMNIPKLGLGTWEIPDNRAAQAVRDAVKIGYRLIDTAQGLSLIHILSSPFIRTHSTPAGADTKLSRHISIPSSL